MEMQNYIIRQDFVLTVTKEEGTVLYSFVLAAEKDNTALLSAKRQIGMNTGSSARMPIVVPVVQIPIIVGVLGVQITIQWQSFYFQLNLFGE